MALTGYEKPLGDYTRYELIEIALGEKLLINVTADNVIRLLPPLIISHSEATLLAEHLIKIIDKFLDA